MPAFTPGGLRKLSDKGAWFADCCHLASGFSATGLATLATGAWPSEHGIVADSWYDRAAKSRIHASDEALLATTFLAEAAASHARISVISMDPARARLFAGAPEAMTYWMDEGGQFQASGTAPEWLDRFNLARPLDKLHDARWNVPGVRTDAPPLRTLTYDAAHPEQFVALYKASPFAQDAQFDLASELIAREGLGRGDTLDIVCLLAGSSELLGNETGERSPLMEQMLLQFDRRLEALLAQLTRSHGDAGFHVAFTAAHGAPDAPPAAARARMAVDGEALARRVDAALNTRGLGRVEKYLYPFLYLNGAGVHDLEEMRRAAGRAAMEHPAVADYYTLEGASSAASPWRERFRNSFHPRRSGDVMLSYRPGYVENFAPGGVSYGSLYNYDARVPLCFYGPLFRTGVSMRTVESVDLAPTLARAFGLAEPSSSIGRTLSESFL